MLNSLNDAIADMLNFKFTWTLMSSTTQHIYLQSKRIGAVNRGQGGGVLVGALPNLGTTKKMRFQKNNIKVCKGYS